MIKHINNLKRFDFTPNCKTCPYCKNLGTLEYCCSFVIDIMQQDRFHELKKHIIEYVLFDEELVKVEPSNVFFDDDSEWGVTLTFKTNLREEKRLILQELRKALMKSPYFTNIHFSKDSLYKQKHEDYKEYLVSGLDEYLHDEGLV